MIVVLLSASWNESLHAFCVLFLLSIVLFVLLRFTDYDYPFGKITLFLKMLCIC